MDEAKPPDGVGVVIKLDSNDESWMDEFEQEPYDTYTELLPYLDTLIKRTYVELLYDMGWVEEEIVYFEEC